MPLPPGNFRIGEQVLELHSPGHANRLKTVARLPVPEHHPAADFIGIEAFPARLRPRSAKCSQPGHAPRNSFTDKQYLPRFARHTDRNLIRPKLRVRRLTKMQLPARIALHRDLRHDANGRPREVRNRSTSAKSAGTPRRSNCA